MACTGVDALNPICQVASSIGRLGSSVTSSVFSSVATAFGNTADSAINWLWTQMSSATSVSFGGANFELDLGIVSAIAAVVCFGLFIVQLVLSALKRDGTGIGRALRGLVVATVGCAVTLASLDLLLAAVDQLCAGVVSLATGDSIATLGSRIIEPAMFTGLVAGPGAILILSLIAIVAVAVVWFALVVRKMLIIITAIFAPLAFAGGVADLSRGWVRKWLEAMLALVFSKLILILIFVIGLGVLGGMGTPANAGGLSGITSDITGLLILLVAGLSPWMALKLVHFTGEHMATLSGSTSHATSGASKVIAAPQKVASMKSVAHSLGGSQHKAMTPLGAGEQLGAKNSEGLKDTTGPVSGTGSGTKGTAGSGTSPKEAVVEGVATGGAVLAASSVQRTATSAGGTVMRGTQHGSEVSRPGVDVGQSPQAAARGTSDENLPPGVLPSTSISPSTSKPNSSPSSVPPMRFNPPLESPGE
jgi:hypothetical protein